MHYWYTKACIWCQWSRMIRKMPLGTSRLKEWCRCAKVSKNINWNGGVIVSETRSARCDRKICQCNTVTSKTGSEFQKLLYPLSPNFGKFDIAQPDHSPRTEMLSKTFRGNGRKWDFPCIEGKRYRNLIHEKRAGGTQPIFNRRNTKAHSRQRFRWKLFSKSFW